nr:hypothetical protein GCM10020093_080700 [Planobispora longispora]
MERLAERVVTAPVPPVMRPPRSGGRPAAVLLLFGEGPLGPDVLLIQRSSRGGGTRASPPSPAEGSIPPTAARSPPRCARPRRRRGSTRRAFT